jgi:hypothetical protein
MPAAGTRAHLVMVLCDLMLKRRALFLQMESCCFELSLLLPQLVYTWVGQDFCVCHSSTPIGRMQGSPVPPMRGAVIGIRNVSFKGRFTVRVINDLRHEAFARGW